MERQEISCLLITEKYFIILILPCLTDTRFLHASLITLVNYLSVINKCTKNEVNKNVEETEKNMLRMHIQEGI